MNLINLSYNTVLQTLEVRHYGSVCDVSKTGLYFGNFYRDSLGAQTFKTLISSLFEDIWISIEPECYLKIEEAML